MKKTLNSTSPEPKKTSAPIHSAADEMNKDQTDEQLKQRYQILAEILPVGIFHADADGSTTYVNPRWCEISGLSYEEALGNGWFNAVHEEDRALLSAGWKKATRSKEVSVSEYRFLRPDGSIAWVIGQAVPEKNAKNEIVGWVGTTTDITERKKAEDAIKRNEQKLGLIYNTTKDIVFLLAVADGRYCFTSVNQSFLDVTGLTQDQVVGKYVDEIIPEPSLTLALNNYKAAIDAKQTEQWEETSVYPTGTKTGIASVTPVFDSNGECITLVCSVHDITELKKKESEIIKEKNLSDSIINSLPGVFYLYTREGKFLKWNKNLEDVTMYNAEEIATMHPLDFFDEDEKPILIERIANVFIAGEDNVQAGFLRKDGKKLPYYFTGRSIEYGGTTCLGGVGIDFTERIKAQEMVKATSEQLRLLTAHLQNIREEERRRIGREIHDELGQQLTAIKMDVSWIYKKIPEENAILKSKLKNVIALLDSGNRSVRRILNELRPVILQHYGLLETLKWQGRQFTANTGIPLEFDIHEPQFDVTDETATCVFRVYQEALTNITRYSQALRVLVSLNVVDDHLQFIIEDDGRGFDPADLLQKKSFGILGMKERVLSVNGDFELITAPGEGTRVNISIPLKKMEIK